MDINKMTLNEFEEYVNKEKERIQDIKTPWKIGAAYLIRTVTMIYTGKLEKEYPSEIVVSHAAWIPETVRWSDSCATGNFNEVEPYPKNAEVIIEKGAILDAFVVTWRLPDEQK